MLRRESCMPQKQEGLTSHLEDVVEGLLLDLAAPVPGAGQPPVDAGARIEKVVGARAVKGVPEEVRQDRLPVRSGIDSVRSWAALCSATWKAQ